MKDQQSALPEPLEGLEPGRHIARAATAATRRISENTANPRDPDQLAKIGRYVHAHVPSLNSQPVGPCDLHEAEYRLRHESGLTGNLLELTIAGVHALDTAQGVAGFHHVPVSRILNRRYSDTKVKPRPAPTARRPRTRTAPRRRRDGSRRHSTRGGTDDDHHQPEEPPAEPTPPDGRRFCALPWCDTDITGQRSNRKYCDEHTNVRARVATHRARRIPPSKIDFDGWSIQKFVDRASTGCTCNGHHVLDPWDGNCLKCGRPWRDDVAPFYLHVWEHEHESLIPSHLGRSQSKAVVA